SWCYSPWWIRYRICSCCIYFGCRNQAFICINHKSKGAGNMEVFRCTVHVKQQLTKEACRYYIRHNHARSWTSPIYATLTFVVAETAVLHIAWYLGIPAHTQVGRALIAFAYGFALFCSIFWLLFMPYSLRTA